MALKKTQRKKNIDVESRKEATNFTEDWKKLKEDEIKDKPAWFLRTKAFAGKMQLACETISTVLLQNGTKFLKENQWP